MALAGIGSIIGRGVLYPAVSLVSRNPEGSHNHPAGDARALAQSRLSLLLALEVAPCKRVREFTEGVIAPVDTEAAQTLLVGRDPQVRHELSGLLHHGTPTPCAEEEKYRHRYLFPRHNRGPLCFYSGKRFGGPFKNTSKNNLLERPQLKALARLGAWYVVANPASVHGLEYAYLAGQTAPQIESRAGFEVDGVQIRVRLDYGAGFIESRGWYRNAGQ